MKPVWLRSAEMSTARSFSLPSTMGSLQVFPSSMSSAVFAINNFHLSYRALEIIPSIRRRQPQSRVFSGRLVCGSVLYPHHQLVYEKHAEHGRSEESCVRQARQHTGRSAVPAHSHSPGRRALVVVLIGGGDTVIRRAGELAPGKVEAVVPESGGPSCH